MAGTTTNLSLRKPASSAPSDVVSVSADISANMDIIDALLSTITPTTAAIGDTASSGTTVLRASRGDHKHGMPAFGSPTTQAIADTAADGTATTIARSNHLHGMPAFATAAAITSVVAATSAGTATTIPRADHAHGIGTAFAPVRGFSVADTTTGQGNSFNVTSITDGVAGVSTVVWATDFAGDTYMALSGSRGNTLYTSTLDATFAAGVTAIETIDHNGVRQDPTHFYCIAMGTQ